MGRTQVWALTLYSSLIQCHPWGSWRKGPRDSPHATRVAFLEPVIITVSRGNKKMKIKRSHPYADTTSTLGDMPPFMRWSSSDEQLTGDQDSHPNHTVQPSLAPLQWERMAMHVIDRAMAGRAGQLASQCQGGPGALTQLTGPENSWTWPF